MKSLKKPDPFFDKAEKQLSRITKIVDDIKKDGYQILTISHIDHDIVEFISSSLHNLGYNVKKRTDSSGNFHLDFFLNCTLVRKKSYMDIMYEMDELEKVEISDELVESLKKHFGLDKGD